MRGYRRRTTPEHRKIKLGIPTPGTCRFCTNPILHPVTKAVLTRKTWHPLCVVAYKQQADPTELRKVIWDRDMGICAKWGRAVAPMMKDDYPHMSSASIAYQLRNRGGDYWQADHIVPLAAGGSFEHSNVQTLCTVCHKKKSKLDLQTIKLHRKGGGIPQPTEPSGGPKT